VNVAKKSFDSEGLGDPSEARDENEGTADRIALRAAELFAAKGIDGTSMREIAEAVGVTKPTLYYHFGNKDGLVSHLLQFGIRRFMRNAEALFDPDIPFVEALRGLAQAQLTFAEENPHMVALHARLNFNPPQQIAGGAFGQMQEKGHELLVKAFEAAQARGEIDRADAQTCALSFIGALVFNMIHRQRFPERARVSVEELAHQIVSLFMDGAHPCTGEDKKVAMGAPDQESI
jgi:AcrR family transcriptional regulator